LPPGSDEESRTNISSWASGLTREVPAMSPPGLRIVRGLQRDDLQRPSLGRFEEFAPRFGWSPSLGQPSTGLSRFPRRCGVAPSAALDTM